MSSNKLRVTRKSDYEHELQPPTIVGYFSIDRNRQFLPTFENLKYFYEYEYPLRVPFNLNNGYDCYKSKDGEALNNEKLNHVLRWIDHNNYLDKLRTKKVFVCVRGSLSTIMRTPFENSEGWIICAEKVKDIIFLYAFDTEEKKKRVQSETDKEKLLTYYGFKFEQYLLSDNPGEEPVTSLPVNSNEEFELVYENKLNNHEILYVAEVDGINSASPVDLKSELEKHKIVPNQFIELKTSFEPNQRSSRSFKRYKSLKWWAQSHLVGIEKITCGFRNDAGLVRRLQNYDTNRLPYQAQDWNTRACYAFLDDFLTFVRDKLHGENDYTRWTFRWNPSEPFVSAKKDDEFVILPEWFTQKCKVLSIGS